MALLEYECGACGCVFEELVRAGEEPVCPQCGGRELRRLWSPVGSVGAARISRAARRDSDLRRTEREAARKEKFVERRKTRRTGSS
ncbi:MAG: zinc ribbon domain-containing protein [Solirubrobacterales bacterium]|nr:zinc ribbon domain-containing protein [Solirubrobacterales bacterium]